MKEQKKIVLIYSQECIKKLKNYLNNEKYKVISLNPALDFFLGEILNNYSKMDDYNLTGISNETVFNDGLNLINNIGNMKIRNKNLHSILKIKDISIWDLLTEELLEYNFTFIIQRLKIIDQIVKKEKPSEIVFYDYQNRVLLERDRNLYPETITIVALKYDIPMKKITSFKIHNRIYTFLSYKLIKLAGKFREIQRKGYKDYKLKPNSKLILFIKWGPKLRIIKPIYDMLIKKGYDSLTVCTDGVGSNSTTLSLRREHMSFSNFENFIDKKIVKSSKLLNKKILNIYYENIVKKKNQSYMFQGYNVFPLIKYNIAYSFKNRTEKLIKEILTHDKIFRILKPSATVVQTDQNSYSKAAVLISNKNNIPSFVIQHGAFAGGSAFLKPVSDYLVLWSDREFDDKKKYIDSNRLKIIGSIGHESLYKKYKKFDSRKIKNKLKIEKNKKIILFVANFVITRDLSRIQIFIESIKNLKDIVAIIKFHPAESSMSTIDVSEIFSEVIRKNNVNVIFIQHMNFYELLKISDLVISIKHCTTVIDTIIMGKPLIVHESDSILDESSSVLDFGKDAPFITSVDKDLRRIIQDIIYDVKKLDKIVKNENTYSKLHYKFDDKSKNRMADFIISKIE